MLLLVAVIDTIDIASAWRALALTQTEMTAMVAAAGVVILFGALVPTGLATFAWHTFSNLMAERRIRPVATPRIVDGDTLDDAATGIRYRLANIDAPETGDNAKCFRESERGEEAAATAAYLVSKAQTVTVRWTFRVDRYGRRVAFVQGDGADLGELLMARGLARPWRGKRVRWCGRKGGLVAIARRSRAACLCDLQGLDLVRALSEHGDLLEARVLQSLHHADDILIAHGHVGADVEAGV